MKITIPEHYKIVSATPGPVTTNGGVTLDYVSLKNCLMAWIILHFTQAEGHATGFDPKQATAVAGTGVKVFAKTLPFWLNEDVALTDTLVRGTDAITMDLAATVKKKLLVVQVDPTKLDGANSFDVLGGAIDDSSQATNFVSGLYLLETTYAQATPPSAIVD